MDGKRMKWESDIDCLTEHGGFQPVCLDQWVLQTAAYQTSQECERSATNGPEHKLVKSYYILIRKYLLMYHVFNIFKFYA